MPGKAANSPKPAVENAALLSRRLVNALSHLHVAVATFDASGQCTFFSPLLYELFHKEPKSIDDLVMLLSKEADTQHHLLRAFESVRNGRTEPPADVRLKDEEGVERIYTIESFVFDDAGDGELAVMVKDTSHEMSLRRDLEHIGRLAALGQITAGVAHELNNILTSVLGWTQIAAENTEPGSINSSALEIISGNARRAMEIATRLLGVSRPPRDSYGPISLTGIAQGVLKLLSWEMNKAGIEVVRSFETDELCWGDENRIGQVFINLVRNAMDAMPAGGALNISVKKKGDRIEASFTDTGPGMSPGMLDRIFDPFFSTKDAGETGVHGGTGLGLAICRDILEQHNGEISVESAPGRGTSFSVTLPVTECRVEPEQEKRDSRPSFAPNTRVLVVDDEPDIGEMVRVSLELKGATVVTVKTGDEAVAACSEKKFDAAFVDFSMPGLSGNNLSREMLLLQPDLPIIFMSGRDVAIDKGASIAEFLKKPFDLDAVQRKLVDVLRGSGIG
jgi:signal transduction histidine kinase